MERFENRYAIFVTDGLDGQELVFRVCASPLEPNGAEIYVPLKRLGYQPGDWYHIDVACRGEDPSTMRLLVDGVDVGIRRGFTYLASDIGTDEEEIQLESTEQFPERGAVRIGHEIIEYDLRGDESLSACTRGARGTLATEWLRGTPVQILGYSLPLTIDIMPGSGHIESKLRQWEAVQVVSGMDTETWTPPGSTTSHTLMGYAPDRTEIVVDVAPMYNQGNVRDGTCLISVMPSRRRGLLSSGVGGFPRVDPRDRRGRPTASSPIHRLRGRQWTLCAAGWRRSGTA